MPRAKAQRAPSSEEIARSFSLRAWRLGAKIFIKTFLLAIPLGFEIGKKMPRAKAQRTPSSEEIAKSFSFEFEFKESNKDYSPKGAKDAKD